MARVNDKLNNQETGLANSLATHFSRRVGIESTPAALLGFNFTKVFLTSLGHVATEVRLLGMASSF